MSVIRKDLGIATAYGYAVSKGYTGTEEEFAELMASYATVAEEAQEAAEQATQAVQTAQAAVNSATTKAGEAATSASGAATSASQAGQSATAAAGSASTASAKAAEAGTSATNAAASETVATQAAQVATTKAGEASASATAASQSATAAAGSASDASDDADRAETAAGSVSAAAEQIVTNTEDIADLKSAIGSYAPIVAITDGNFINPVGNENPAANSCVTDFILVVPGMKISLSKLLLTSARSVCAYTADKKFIKRIAGGTPDTSILYTVEDGVYFIRATGASGTPPTIVYMDLLSSVKTIAISNSGDSVYVTKTGNDATGDGSLSTPFATVNRAVSSGAENIYIASGIYDETIDLSKSNKCHLRFINVGKDTRVIFQRSETVITATETAVSGYSNVYSAQTSKTFNESNPWIYQDNVPDARTEISLAERHPAQKGRKYRNEDTKIIKCTATALNDALAEIEASADYKWFVNSDTIYFSRPQAVTEQNPICAGFGHTLFANNQHYHSVELYGIDAKYMSINLNNMKNAKAVDCSAINVFGAGAFTYNSRNTFLLRCEAANCVNGVNGDGFNGAASLTGDSDASQTTTELIDCWAHDNRDDGYSDHNRSDAVMRGGLYEYNTKAGVTPSSGENFAAYGVMSRKNQRGFFLTTGIADNSKVVCSILYNCIANDNTGRDDSSGFTINAPGTMTLVECIAMNSPAGYRSDGPGLLIMMDCKVFGTNVAKGGTGDITVINADPVLS